GPRRGGLRRLHLIPPRCPPDGDRPRAPARTAPLRQALVPPPRLASVPRRDKPRGTARPLGPDRGGPSPLGLPHPDGVARGTPFALGRRGGCALADCQG